MLFAILQHQYRRDLSHYLLPSYTHTHTYVCIYIHTHTHTHTHTQTTQGCRVQTATCDGVGRWTAVVTVPPYCHKGRPGGSRGQKQRALEGTFSYCLPWHNNRADCTELCCHVANTVICKIRQQHLRVCECAGVVLECVCECACECGCV